MVLNWDIGRGFCPNPTSIVNPGLLYSPMNQSLYPAYAASYGTFETVYPLALEKVFAIVRDSDGAKFW